MEIEPGQIIDGTVKGVPHYGVYFDIVGGTALLLIPNIPLSLSRDLQGNFVVGVRHRLLVDSVNREKQTVSVRLADFPDARRENSELDEVLRQQSRRDFDLHRLLKREPFIAFDLMLNHGRCIPVSHPGQLRVEESGRLVFRRASEVMIFFKNDICGYVIHQDDDQA
ncbi:MAG: hypothetical protein AAGD32_05625 [Planctomycetota bacterium]